jgi:hypothetical protein
MTTMSTPDATSTEPAPPSVRPSWVRRCGYRVADYVKSAPGTYIWLLILGLNTFALVHMSPRVRKYFLFTHSTNLDELRHHPVKVLVTSAFWTETPSFFFWFLIFNLFHVPAERWLGTLRWLLVVVLAHVGATLISEGAVDLLIRAGALPHKETRVIDIGVSYALSGSVGVLTWLFARPYRWFYLGATGAFYLALLIGYRDFTNLGHLAAYLIGLACFPVTRARGWGRWKPWWAR